jgi:hypothetical protein
MRNTESGCTVYGGLRWIHREINETRRKKMNGPLGRVEVTLTIYKCMVNNFGDSSRIFQGPIEYYFFLSFFVFNITILIQNFNDKMKTKIN